MNPLNQIKLSIFCLLFLNINECFSQTTFTPIRVQDGLTGAGQIEIADMDNDGDLDFVAHSSVGSWDSPILHWFQNDGSTPPNFQMHVVEEFNSSLRSMSIDDVNGDNHNDIIIGSSDGVFVILHDGNALPNFDIVTLTTFDNFSRARAVASADIDLDGDIDVLTAYTVLTADSNNVLDSDGRISWWENKNGTGVEFTEHSIETWLYFPHEVTPHDFDLDGDIDIFGTTRGMEDDIIWYKNLGTGDSVVFEKIIVEDSFQSAEFLSIADLDGDGDNDIVGTGDCWYEVHWWEQNEGSFIRHSIKDFFYGANWVHTVDLDLDGDIDVLGTSGAEGIYWWENNGSTPPSFEEHILTTNPSSAVVASNLDNEPTLEILGSIGTDSGPEIVMWNQDVINNNTENVKEYGFKLFPNPMKKLENAHVEIGEEIISGHISIYNQLGNFVTKRKIKNNSFSVIGLPNGIYVVKVEVGERVFTEKIVVY